MITTPRHWTTRGAKAWVLAPVGSVWGAVAARRMRAAPVARAAVPVVCVGNFVAGGAGKTPAAIALATLLKQRKLKPCFLSRGYGGEVEGPLRVNPDKHTADEVGDEPLLLARVAPTFVAKDRAAALGMVAKAGVDVVIMDDGFQNPDVAKDFSLVVVAADYGIGNGLCIPAGPLRAPIARQLDAADALLVVGEGRDADGVVRLAARRAMPVLRARFVPRNATLLQGLRAVLFAGIARPQKVERTLRDAGGEAVETIWFPDHHVFTEADAERVLAACERGKLVPVTTEKDLARLAGAAKGTRLHALAQRAMPLRVDLVVEEPRLLVRLVEEARADWRVRHGARAAFTGTKASRTGLLAAVENLWIKLWANVENRRRSARSATIEPTGGPGPHARSAPAKPVGGATEAARNGP